MIILVIDLEATCWRGQPPKGESSEIIEIGTCLVDTQELRQFDKKAYFCKPVRSTVSPFCTELTTITPEMVENAPILQSAVDKLFDSFRVGQHTVWASWGDYDRRMFERHVKQGDLKKYPFGNTHLNVKNLFAMLYNAKRPGLTQAMDTINMPFAGTLHRGEDDAWNIAKVLTKMIKNYRLVG